MTTTIVLSIPSKAKCIVKKGDEVCPGTAIAEKRSKETIEMVNIAKLLGLKSNEISKYLKKAIGAEIEQGEILAVKKTILQSYILRSPIKGVIKEINVKKGTLSIKQIQRDLKKIQKIKSPIKGQVVNIGKTQIEIEVDNLVYRGRKGEGEEASGKILYIEGNKIDILDIPAEASSSIILCRELEDASEVKLDVLEASGLILVKKPKSSMLPFLEIEEQIFNKLISHSNKRAWIRPSEKEVIIIE